MRPLVSSRVQIRVALDGCTSKRVRELSEVAFPAREHDEDPELGQRDLVLDLGERPRRDADERTRTRAAPHR